MSILHDIVAATEREISLRKQRVSIAQLRSRALDLPKPRSLADALGHGFSVIGEVKAKSPSAGSMCPANVDIAAKVYDNTPAISAISVLTEPHFFDGRLERLWEIREVSGKPLLRKDFIIDEYQVWEARAYGADAILLMASLHLTDRDRLHRLFDLASDLGMESLVEIGMAEKSVDPEDMARIVPDDARIWGANSRRFHGTRLQIKATASRLTSRLLGVDFTTDIGRHELLRRFIPSGKIAVAESGVPNPAYLFQLSELRYDAALIGTTFLKHGVKVANAVESHAKAVFQIRNKR